MKAKSTLLRFLVLAASSLLAISSASALTYYWDGNDATTGFGTAGGTWADPTAGTATSGWSTDSTGSTAINGNSVSTGTADTLNFGTSTALYGLAAGTITVSGTVNAGSITQGSQSGTITLSGGTINLASTATITTSSTVVIDSLITGAGTSLTKGGAGTLRLSNTASTYTGATLIGASTNGVLEATALANGGVASSIGASSSAAGNLVLSNINTGVLRYIGTTNASSDRLFTLGNQQGYPGGFEVTGTGTLNLTSTGAVAFAQANQTRIFSLGGTNTGQNILNPQLIDNGTGALSFIKNGTGNWVVANNSNSYTGTTTINGGTLSVSKMADYTTVSPIGKGAAGAAIVLNGGALNYTGSGDSTNRLIQLTTNSSILNNGTGALNFTTTGNFNVQGSTNANRALTLGGANGGTISGAIQNNSGSVPALSLAKIGSGTWTLAGDNTYTGSTTINAGTLSLTGTNTATGSSVLNGGTLKLDYATNDTSKLSNAAVLTLNGGTLDLAGTGSTHNEVVSYATTGGGTTFVTRSSGNAILDLGQINNLTQSASTTSTSTTVTVADSSVLRVGMPISGTGIPSNTTIASIVDGTTITISAAATATNTITATMGTASLTNGAINFAAGSIAKTSTLNHSSGALASAAGSYRLTVGTDWAKNDGSGNIVAFASGDYTTFTGGATSANVNYSCVGDVTLDASRGATSNTFKINTSASGQSMKLNNNFNLTLGSLLFAGADNYSIAAESGTGRINSAFLLHNYGSGTLTLGATNGAITQYGTGKTILTGNNGQDVGINIFGGTVQFSNNLQIGNNTTTARAIALNNGTLVADTTSADIALNNAGAGSRTVSLGAGGGTLDVIGGNKLTVSGVISDSTAGQFPTLTIGSASTNGTIEFTAANTYTGATAITAGTLKLGANNVLPDGSPVSIGTATLDADTRTDLAGALNVTGSAVINLGSGAALAFADSSGVGAGTWAGTLNITGTLGATSLRFGYGSSGLSSAQLAKISVNGSGLGTYTLDASGYLIAGGGGDVTPPTLTSITDDKSGGPVAINTLITYTVTFSEDIDSASVSAADFDNNGTAGITIGTIAETTPGVFTVQVTPTSSGSLKLRLPGTAVVKDVAGNNLMVPVSDDTTITVQTPYETWSGGAAFNADANSDGVSNGLAWLLGASGPNVSALDKLPTVSQSGGNLVLSFQSLKDAYRGSATLSVEHSSNLGISDPWLAALVSDAGTPANNVTFSISSASTTLNNVTATISSSEAASGKLFGRVKAVNP